MSRLDDKGHRDASHYLADAGPEIRPFAIALALRAMGGHPFLENIHEKGYVQFMQIARDRLKSDGYRSQDVERAWDLIERWYNGDRHHLIVKYLGIRVPPGEARIVAPDTLTLN